MNIHQVFVPTLTLASIYQLLLTTVPRLQAWWRASPRPPTPTPHRSPPARGVLVHCGPPLVVARLRPYGLAGGWRGTGETVEKVGVADMGRALGAAVVTAVR